MWEFLAEFMFDTAVNSPGRARTGCLIWGGALLVIVIGLLLYLRLG